MKNLHNFFVLLLIVTVSFSCKPIYKCGESKPTKKLFLPKIITRVIDERDSLCQVSSSKDVQIYNLTDEVNKKNQQIISLKDNYESLSNAKINESAQYNLLLKQKNEELDNKSAQLDEKEKILQEREKSLIELRKEIAIRDSITNSLTESIKKALVGFKSDELSVEIKDGKVYVSMSDKLLFKSGSATVEDKGLDAIKVLADVLQKNADIVILIEGHTDNLPIKTVLYKDNWDLSVARAVSIVRVLTENYSIDPKRLTASGKGEFYPKATNSTADGRALNRRTEIILSPKLNEIIKLLN